MRSLAVYIAAVLVYFPAMAEAQKGPSFCHTNSTGAGPAAQARFVGTGTPSAVSVPVEPGCIAGHVYHSATAAEGYGRGMAAMIQAQGYFQLATSQAMINAAATQRMHIENKQRRAETYLAMREAYEARRLAAIQTKREAQTVARMRYARPEEDTMVMSIKTALPWPTALRQDKFASYRSLVDRLMVNRAKGLTWTNAERTRFIQATQTVLKSLKEADEIRGKADYAAAHRFASQVLNTDAKCIAQR